MEHYRTFQCAASYPTHAVLKVEEQRGRSRIRGRESEIDSQTYRSREMQRQKQFAYADKEQEDGLTRRQEERFDKQRSPGGIKKRRNRWSIGHSIKSDRT